MDSFLIGLCLALISTFLTGIGLVFKKKGLIIIAENGTRVGNGVIGYLKQWVWLIGISLMTLGEFLNFLAYSFAPASLVTPLGALSVLVTAIISHYMLSEKLNVIGKLGCILCITGSIVIILHVPQEQSLKSFEDLQAKLLRREFLIYCGSILLLIGYLIFVGVRKWGNKNPLVYVIITGSIGSITVISCKGIGVAVHELFKSKFIFSYPFFWVLLLTMLICILCQLTFLNRTLDIFNISVVTPILYVVFTSFVLTASSIAFSELSRQSYSGIMGLVSGFVTVIIGIFLINAFQNISLKLNLVDLIFGGVTANGDVAQKSSDFLTI